MTFCLDGLRSVVYMYNDLTVILPFRNNLDKMKNLNYSLDFYKRIGVEDVLVVEDGDVQTVSTSKFVKNKNLFNRSWLFNIGIKSSKSKILFSDIDTFISSNDFFEAYSRLDHYDFVKPYSRFLNLSNDCSETIRTTNEFLPIVDSVLYPNYGAGMLFSTKSAIDSIGQWPEEFEGWGGEDDVLSLKIKQFKSYTETNNDLYHLYHLRSNEISTNNHKNYDRNRYLALQYFPTLSKTNLEQYIRSINLESLGDENKYRSLTNG